MESVADLMNIGELKGHRHSHALTVIEGLYLGNSCVGERTMRPSSDRRPPTDRGRSERSASAWTCGSVVNAAASRSNNSLLRYVFRRFDSARVHFFFTANSWGGNRVSNMVQIGGLSCALRRMLTSEEQTRGATGQAPHGPTERRLSTGAKEH